MKTFVKSLLALLVVFSVACSKEVSQETGATVITGNNFTAIINGEDWKADSLEQVIVTDSVVTISGLSSTSKEISLVLPTFAVGKYTVNASTAGYGLYTTLSTTATDVYLTNSSVEVAKAGGTVEISAIDTLNKTVTGTFSFTGYRASDQTTVLVTNGVFKALAYSITGTGSGTGTDSTIADNGRDTLSAYIDGKLFVADLNGITAQSTSGMLGLVGAVLDGSFQSFSAYFLTNLSPGSHAIDYPQGVTVLYNASSTDYYIPQDPSLDRNPNMKSNGTVKILVNDAANKRITGQFSFTGYSLPDGSTTKTITGGYFGVTYQ